jgi:hypothetical protein
MNIDIAFTLVENALLRLFYLLLLKDVFFDLL